MIQIETEKLKIKIFKTQGLKKFFSP
jgi:hypothetical protein